MDVASCCPSLSIFTVSGPGYRPHGLHVTDFLTFLKAPSCNLEIYLFTFRLAYLRTGLWLLQLNFQVTLDLQQTVNTSQRMPTWTISTTTIATTTPTPTTTTTTTTTPTTPERRCICCQRWRRGDLWSAETSRSHVSGSTRPATNDCDYYNDGDDDTIGMVMIRVMMIVFVGRAEAAVPRGGKKAPD